MKFENTQVFNLEGALRGMRNPMDSWDKSDSKYCAFNEDIDCDVCPLHKSGCNAAILDCGAYIIGKNDLELAQKLVKAGSEHRKFMRQIFICVDITAPRYWWQEFDTYKVGTVADSCSSVHTLVKHPITPDMFELDNDFDDFDEEYWHYTIKYLEGLRCEYERTKDIKLFRKLKKALPEAFLQKRTITMNYENIYSMKNQRKNHKLQEWSADFISWIENELPYSKELIFLN
jgi:hypothetical protein